MIKKFPLPDVGFNMPFSIQLEEGAKFLSVQVQPGAGPVAWFDCRPSKEPYQTFENREFRFIPTGGDAHGLYLGTFQIGHPYKRESDVYHLFETT